MRRTRKSAAQRLATQAVELSFAAPQVVAHRLTRIATTSNPTAGDRRENLLMGSEKLLAFQQSWAAMWLQAWRQQIAFVQSMAMAITGFGGAARLSPWTSLPSAAAGIFAAGLAPVHRTAVANAKRLSRPGRR